ncbi:MAG: PAS domain-containing protein [candidate division Zixibacteria bacterium]|nr:PAS domain-containing protein [candidate division Zixibacteria bacterium]
MFRRKLIWQLFLSFIIIIVLSVAAVTIYITRSLKEFYLNEMSYELQARAQLIKDNFADSTLLQNTAVVDSLCKNLGKQSSSRITIVTLSGHVIGDTDENPAGMENHLNRPEIQKALGGGVGMAKRYSHTRGEMMLYSAIPILINGQISGAVRVARPLSALDKEFSSIYPRIIFDCIVLLFLAGSISYYFSRRFSVPLEKMTQVSEEFSRGNFQHKLSPGNSIEIDKLAQAMNRMAEQLDEKIKTIINQRNELEAVLSSMVEGVLAFDLNERLVNLNKAAARILDLDGVQALGHYIQEVIRHPHLQAFVKKVIHDGQPMEGEISIQRNGDRVLQMHGTALTSEKGENLGALVVLHDITHIRHLENIRRDFVANVSHELKTPITSIKGFIETLRDGAIGDSDDAARFLDIIARQSDRLNAIVEDLLTLSKIEEAEKTEIPLELGSLKYVIQNAVDACELKLKEKNITLTFECPEDIHCQINKQLLEQAIVNLLDNAIKYSEAGGAIELACKSSNNEAIISVRDWGIGIEKKHLPRLFERFYRVDKGRSSELGGTGLGLAIVKHIAIAHHGYVGVDSLIGKGSVFTIHLPIAHISDNT